MGKIITVLAKITNLNGSKIQGTSPKLGKSSINYSLQSLRVASEVLRGDQQLQTTKYA